VRACVQINVDIISIGENGVNEAKLQAFVDAVNKDGSQRCALLCRMTAARCCSGNRVVSAAG
jgi:hypothetical protein